MNQASSKIFPKISIVTPSFNQADFLESTIQSVLSQQYPNLEYIIIDGGSTDRSVEVIQHYEPYLHFWSSEPDRGQYDAINKGFSHATGDILAWLNSDDLYFPWTLKTVASIMAELPQVEWLTSLNHAIWDRDGFCTTVKQIAGYCQESFLDGCHLLPRWKMQPDRRIRGIQKLLNFYVPEYLGFIQQESTFWRRTLWQTAGNSLSTEFELAGDFDLWATFLAHATLYTTQVPLAGFRRRPDQKSQNSTQYVQEAIVSLARLRQRLNYSPNYAKYFAVRSHLYQYTGKQVVRQYESALSQGSWQIKDYAFR